MRMVHAIMCHNGQHYLIKVRTSIVLLAFIFHFVFELYGDPGHVTQ